MPGFVERVVVPRELNEIIAVREVRREYNIARGEIALYQVTVPPDVMLTRHEDEHAPLTAMTSRCLRSRSETRSTRSGSTAGRIWTSCLSWSRRTNPKFRAQALYEIIGPLVEIEKRVFSYHFLAVGGVSRTNPMKFKPGKDFRRFRGVRTLYHRSGFDRNSGVPLERSFRSCYDGIGSLSA